jgi:hypothetical protein
MVESHCLVNGERAKIKIVEAKDLFMDLTAMSQELIRVVEAP